MDSAYLKTHKKSSYTIRSRPIHHSKVIGPKVNFQNEFWRSSWIYVDYESCPKLPSWQQS